MNKEELLEQISKLSETYEIAANERKEKQEQFWNSLSKEDQLKVFCAVVRRIHEGDVVQKGSYRYVLYNIFGFGTEAYGQAMDAGYLTLHNCIFDDEHDDKLLHAFAKFNNLSEDTVEKFWKDGVAILRQGA